MQLDRWGHVIFATGYVALAAVVAVLLALLRPRTDTVVIVVAAVQVLMAGALAHEVIARVGRERKTAERLQRIRRAYEELVELILQTRKEKRAAAEATATAAPAPALADTPASGVAEAGAASARRSPRPTRGAASATAPSPPPVDADHAALVVMLREALAEQRVECYLQPIVSLPQRLHRGYELLARVRQRDGALLLPERWLAAAERERLIPEIDLLMLRRAGQLIRETDRRQHAIDFFCNLSKLTLTDHTFMTQFLGPGGEFAGLLGKLVLEMRQRELAAELAAPMSVIHELAEVGFRFSMDQLDRLDIDAPLLRDHRVRFLKVSGAFCASPERRAGVVDLRRRLQGLPVDLIVDQVETEAQLQALEDLGFELGQGTLLGEPRPGRRLA